MPWSVWPPSGHCRHLCVSARLSVERRLFESHCYCVLLGCIPVSALDVSGQVAETRVIVPSCPQIISNRHMRCSCFANIFLHKPSGVHFAKHLACKRHATPHIAQRKLQEDLPLEDRLTCEIKCSVEGYESKRPFNANKCSSQSIYFVNHLISQRGDAVKIGRGDPK